MKVALSHWRALCFCALALPFFLLTGLATADAGDAETLHHFKTVLWPTAAGPSSTVAVSRRNTATSRAMY